MSKGKGFSMADIAKLQAKGLKITGLEPRISQGKVFVSEPKESVPSDGSLLVFEGLKLFVGTNVDRLRHWAARAAEKKIFAYQILAQNPKKFEGKVKITMTRYTVGQMDEDNLGTSYKSCGDTLVKMGIIKDDSPQYVKFIAKQVKVKTRKEQKVTVHIEQYHGEEEFL